jgi:hypothetical protein
VRENHETVYGGDSRPSWKTRKRDRDTGLCRQKTVFLFGEVEEERPAENAGRTFALDCPRGFRSETDPAVFG